MNTSVDERSVVVTQVTAAAAGQLREVQQLPQYSVDTSVAAIHRPVDGALVADTRALQVWDGCGDLGRHNTFIFMKPQEGDDLSK